MRWRNWEDLPTDMQTEEVRDYYQILACKRGSLLLKRIFDIVLASALLVILSPIILLISILILADSPGGVFFRQERVTAYGEKFRIHKFRTMVADAEKIGTQVTVENDMRITKVGAFLRKYRLDELPQLLDIVAGTMSLVGTRPEIPKYVNQYTEEMKATLLLPAGVTSEASIRYKDEAKLLNQGKDVDRIYVEEVLPEKMKYNLDSIRNFSFRGEIVTMFRTVFAVLDKEFYIEKSKY